MSRIEIGMAMLAITCMVWARIHHWRATRNTDSNPATPTEPA